MISSTHYQNLPSFSDRQLPIRLHERPSSDDTAQQIACIGAIATALMAPPAVIYALFMLGEANFSSLDSDAYRPVAVSLSLFILVSAFAKTLFAWVLGCVGRRRIITINETQVTVREKTLFGTSEWCEPLARYGAVEREESATAGGWQQRLVLSHPDPNRRILVWSGEHIPDSLVSGYRSLLSRSARRHARAQLQSELTTD